MTLRRKNTIAAGERRTQGARIAALFARLRTHCRTGQRVLAAVASLFNSLLERFDLHGPRRMAEARPTAQGRRAPGVR